jgi:hypothetical protein
MPETKIYKVQVPIDTNVDKNDDMPDVMAYTQRKKGQFVTHLTSEDGVRAGKHRNFFWSKNIPDLKKWMKGRPKAFFHARIEGELKERKLIIESEADWQNW